MKSFKWTESVIGEVWIEKRAKTTESVKSDGDNIGNATREADVGQ